MIHCGFGYPMAEHAQDAGANLFRMLVGQEPRDLPCLVHCSWVLSGYCLSLGLPDVHPPMMATDQNSLEVALCDELKKLVTKDPASGGVTAVDWSRVLMLVKLLLEIFAKK